MCYLKLSLRTQLHKAILDIMSAGVDYVLEIYQKKELIFNVISISTYIDNRGHGAEIFKHTLSDSPGRSITPNS